MSTKHLQLNDTKIVKNLKLKYERRCFDVNDYSIFQGYYVEIYKKYFQKSAQFELNLPFDMSNKLSSVYNSINKEDQATTIVSKEFFQQNIWTCMASASLEIYVLLWSTFQRYLMQHE